MSEAQDSSGATGQDDDLRDLLMKMKDLLEKNILPFIIGMDLGEPEFDDYVDTQECCENLKKYLDDDFESKVKLITEGDESSILGLYMLARGVVVPWITSSRREKELSGLQAFAESYDMPDGWVPAVNKVRESWEEFWKMVPHPDYGSSSSSSISGSDGEDSFTSDMMGIDGFEVFSANNMTTPNADDLDPPRSTSNVPSLTYSSGSEE